MDPEGLGSAEIRIVTTFDATGLEEAQAGLSEISSLTEEQQAAIQSYQEGFTSDLASLNAEIAANSAQMAASVEEDLGGIQTTADDTTTSLGGESGSGGLAGGFRALSALYLGTRLFKLVYDDSKTALTALGEWNTVPGKFDAAKKSLDDFALSHKTLMTSLVGGLAGMGLVAAAFLTIGGAVGLLAMAAAALGLEIAPLLLGLAAVGLLIGGAVYEAMTHGKEIMTELKDWWDKGSTSVLLLRDAGNLLKDAWNLLSDDVINHLLPDLEKLWNQISPVLIPALKILAEVFAGALYAAVLGFVVGLDAIVEGLDLVIQKLSEFIGWVGKTEQSLANSTIGKLLTKGVASVESTATSALQSLHVPGFASGVKNFGGGLAMVGENGPELVNLPSGSSVTPSGQTAQLMNQSGGDVHVHIEGPLMINDANMIGQLADTIAQRIGMRARQNLNGSY